MKTEDYEEEQSADDSLHASPVNGVEEENGDDDKDRVVESRNDSRSPSHKKRKRSKSTGKERKRSKDRSRSRSPRRRRRDRSGSRDRSRSRERSSRRRRRSSGSPPPSFNSGARRGRGGRPDPAGAKASRCLGVFGMSVYTSEKDLKEVFGQYGPIESVQLVLDRPTGKSRGFGFLYFESKDDAVAAKDAMTDREIDGHQIRVDFSYTKRAHSPTPGQYMGRGGGPTRGFARGGPPRGGFRGYGGPPPYGGDSYHGGRDSYRPPPPPSYGHRGYDYEDQYAHHGPPSGGYGGGHYAQPPPRDYGRYSRSPSPRGHRSSRHHRSSRDRYGSRDRSVSPRHGRYY